MKKSITSLLVFFFLAATVLNLYSFGQEQKPQLRKEIVQVRYLDVASVSNLISVYRSSYGRIQWIRERNAIIIEDTPESVEKLLSILKEIDVKPLDVQFTVDLIMGALDSTSAGFSDKEIKSDPVLRELSSLLRYKAFKSLDSAIIKVQDNSRSRQRIGGEGLSFILEMYPRYIKEEKADTFQVKLELDQYKPVVFSPEGKELRSSTIVIDTTFSLKSGERTVVGVSKLDGGDKALILIISGKVIK